MRTADVAPDRHGSSSRTSCSDSLRTALRLDLRLHRVELRAVLALVFGFGVISFGGTRIGFFLIFMAAVMPAYLAHGDHPSAPELRSSLGIARADVIRARTRIVCTVQTVLIVLGTFVVLFGYVDDESSLLVTLTAGTVLVNGPSAEVWADILTWVPAIVVAHAAMGRVALSEGRRVYEFLCLLIYLGTYLGLVVLAVLISAPLGAFSKGPARDVWELVQDTPMLSTVRVVVGALALVGAVAALAMRHRTWIREA
jgi:hypothetical protein